MGSGSRKEGEKRSKERGVVDKVLPFSLASKNSIECTACFFSPRGKSSRKYLSRADWDWARNARRGDKSRRGQGREREREKQRVVVEKRRDDKVLPFCWRRNTRLNPLLDFFFRKGRALESIFRALIGIGREMRGEARESLRSFDDDEGNGTRLTRRRRRRPRVTLVLFALLLARLALRSPLLQRLSNERASASESRAIFVAARGGERSLERMKPFSLRWKEE